MRQLLFFIAILFTAVVNLQSQTFSATGSCLESTPDAGTQLSTIYIFNSLTGATITYHSTTGNPYSVYKYKTSQADKVAITEKPETTPSYIISNLEDGYGYMVVDDGLDPERPRAVWVFNYQDHKPIIHSIDVIDSDVKCKVVDLSIKKSDAMPYYGVQGQMRNVERRYDIEYKTLKWNETNEKFEDYTAKYDSIVIGTDFQVDPPLKDTEFTISGDQFGKNKKFNNAVSLSSSTYTAVSTEGHIIAEQEYRENTNEVDASTSGLGGSAPANISFYGYANEPTTRFFTWYIYNTSDLKNYVERYTDQNMKYNFQQSGNYRVVLETTDLTNTCTSRDSVEFKITESKLDVPNFFSPGDSPGVNDEFRVAYKSLVSFKCVIFNRWGNKLYEFNDPAKGWDGRYKGKLVNPGVYFYVIEAKGSDGEVYKKKGDINIVRSR